MRIPVFSVSIRKALALDVDDLDWYNRTCSFSRHTLQFLDNKKLTNFSKSIVILAQVVLFSENVALFPPTARNASCGHAEIKQNTP